MANTYTLISSNTLTSSAASVTFSSIPSTYTDLVLRISARDDSGADASRSNITVNALGAVFSETRLYSNSTTPTSDRNTGLSVVKAYGATGGGSTANTFGLTEVYFPNYTVAINKPIAIWGAPEKNAASLTTAPDLGIFADLMSSTATISQLTITSNATNFVSGSSFYLYGIKNS